MPYIKKNPKSPPKKIYIFQQIELRFELKTAATARQIYGYKWYKGNRSKNIRIITDGILLPFYFVIYLIYFMRRGPRQKLQKKFLLATTHRTIFTSFIYIS